MNTKKTLLLLVSLIVVASFFFESRGFSGWSVGRSESAGSVASGSEDTIQVSLQMASGSVIVSVPAGASVYDAMLEAASTTNFRFVARRYPGLGYFVESVGSIGNAGGFYWTLYVNGVYSVTGASSRVLRPSDVIEWRFEKQ